MADDNTDNGPHDSPPQPLCLPAPATDDSAARGPSGDPNRTGGPKRRRRSALGLPSREGILAELNALKGALAANFIAPAQANAMARVYQLMLECLTGDEGRNRGPGELHATLAELARRDPKILNDLESFLTDEQFDRIIAEIGDGRAEQSSEGTPSA